MPQLNPDPWFMMLFWTWFAYSIMFQPKITSHQLMNDPIIISTTYYHYPNTYPWTWKWT